MSTQIHIVKGQRELNEEQRAAVRLAWRKRAYTDVAIAAQLYIEAGYRVVPLRPGTKEIHTPDWGNLVFTPDMFGPGSNIGVQCVGDLVDTDIDCQLALRAAKHFLPPTDRIHGRPGKPDSHWWYRVVDGVFKQFRDINGEMIIEIRAGRDEEGEATAAQTVVPPSIWVNKKNREHREPLAWTKEGRGTEVDRAAHQGAVVSLATATLIARHWPGSGRHLLRLAYSRVLLETLKLSDATATTILEWACRLGGSDENGVNNVAQAVKSTRKKLDADKPATGGKTVKDLLTDGAKIIDQLREWHGVHAKVELVILKASDVPNESIEKIFGGRLVRGTFEIVAGPGEAGKGMFAVDTLARFTTGEPFAGEGTEWREPVNVLLCTTEDSMGRVKGRLRAAGADLNRVYFAVGPPVVRGGLVMPSPVMLDDDAGSLVRKAQEIKAEVLFLETTVEHLGDRQGKSRFSTHNEAEVRRALAPTRAICREARLFGFGAMHPRKSMDGGIEDSISGSAAFRNVGRSVLHVYRDPMDERPDPWRLLCASKANYMRFRPPTLRFRIEAWEQDPDEGRVVWGIEGTSLIDSRTAEEIYLQMRERHAGPRRDVRVAEAEEFLQRVLANGMLKPEEIFALAKDDGIGGMAVRRAKKNLEIVSVKSGFPAEVVGWKLPESEL